METRSIGSRKLRILGALLFASLVTGCYGPGWGGGGSGYYPDYGTGYSGNSYYTNNVYRGYGRDPQSGLFGGYPPAHEAWDASTRGRTSYGGGEGHGGGGNAGHGGGSEHGGGGHAGGGGGGHGGGNDHGH